MGTEGFAIVTSTLIAGLITYHLALLVAADKLFQEPRLTLFGWLRTRGPIGRFLGDLITCVRCSSVWIAAPVVWALDLWVGVPAPVAVYGAAAGISGALAVRS